jgi:hypothetical protein
MSDWPKYESHKIVQAMKIVAYRYDDQGTMVAAITEDGADFVPALPGMMNRSSPGDYAMLYPDGYKSVSPAKAFEEGYTICEPDAAELGAAVRRAGLAGP